MSLVDLSFLVEKQKKEVVVTFRKVFTKVLFTYLIRLVSKHKNT